jgi:hypothetical protein
MATFLEIRLGVYLVSSEVAEVIMTKDANTQVVTKGGHIFKTCLESCRVKQKVEKDTGATIPAKPGHSVVCAYPPSDDDEDWSIKTFPVIGWTAAEEETEYDRDTLFDSTPIVSGVNDLAYHWALVEPTGNVVERWGHEYKDIHEWLEHVKNEEFNELKERLCR